MTNTLSRSLLDIYDTVMDKVLTRFITPDITKDILYQAVEKDDLLQVR